MIGAMIGTGVAAGLVALPGVSGVVHLDTGPAKVLNDETVSPGTVGSIVMGILIIAVVLLLRSFLKHLRKVPPDFDNVPEADPTHVVPGSEDHPA
jgi:hypothetical protein